MLKFLVWYIIGTVVLLLFNGIFMACYSGSKMSKKDYDEILDKCTEKALQPLIGIVWSGMPKILQLLFVVLIFPIYEIAVVIYMIQGIDEYKKSQKGS